MLLSCRLLVIELSRTEGQPQEKPQLRAWFLKFPRQSPAPIATTPHPSPPNPKKLAIPTPPRSIGFIPSQAIPSDHSARGPLLSQLPPHPPACVVYLGPCGLSTPRGGRRGAARPGRRGRAVGRVGRSPARAAAGPTSRGTRLAIAVQAEKGVPPFFFRFDLDQGKPTRAGIDPSPGLSVAPCKVAGMRGTVCCKLEGGRWRGSIGSVQAARDRGAN